MWQRSSTGHVCGRRLYSGVLNDANGGLSLLDDGTQFLRSDRFAILFEFTDVRLESPQDLTRSSGLLQVSL
jgi:hypothetical protein